MVLERFLSLSLLSFRNICKRAFALSFFQSYHRWLKQAHTSFHAMPDAMQWKTFLSLFILLSLLNLKKNNLGMLEKTFTHQRTVNSEGFMLINHAPLIWLGKESH